MTTKERPILFSAPMVRALLDGSKTQTRRVVKPQHLKFFDRSAAEMMGEWSNRPLPHGQPGDRLWVRETFADLQGTGIEHRPISSGPLQRYAFAADTKPGSHGDEARKEFGVKWKPSIFMPRAASRITLEITGVRVERLQDISETDAIEEGVTPDEVRQITLFGASAADRAVFMRDAAVRPYRALWESINGPDSWAANPWVWVIEFKRVNT